MQLKISQSGNVVGIADRCRSVTIGRDPNAEVTVEDGAVSAFHTRLTRRGALWWLSDLESVAGTQLNGVAVKKSLLIQQGDVITLGDCGFEVALSSAEEKAATKLRGAPDPSDDPAAQAHLRLRGVGSYALNKDSFLIGKDEGSDLRLTGWQAPGQLAVILRTLGGHYLVNLTGSGVLHEGKPLKELRIKLKDGDRLEFRDVYGTFQLGACRS